MELKKLQDENAALRKELLDARTLYKQLIQETSCENFDERRVTLLKSQMIQLERQVLLMSEALTSRSSTLLEVENLLCWLGDHCRSLIALEVPGPDVPVPRSNLTKMVEKVESTRMKLFKHIENTSKDNLSKPMMFFSTFVKPANQGEVTLFEICSGNLDHLNLKQVANLESQLCQLYKDLMSVQHSVTCWKANLTLTSAVSTERLSTQMLKAMARLDECAKDLQSLSLLYPAAPWPRLKRPVCGDITPDKVISTLPSLPRSKSLEVHKVIEAICKTTNHQIHIHEQEVKALHDEVKFHQTIYSLQNQYIKALFEAVMSGYKEFERNVEHCICTPLREILEAYKCLKDTTGAGALEGFLRCFKDREQTLESTISSLSQFQEKGESSGSQGLSAFGKEFFASVEKHCKECQLVRDKNARENNSLREEQARLDSALQILLNQSKTTSSAQDSNSQHRSDSVQQYKSALIKNKEEGPSVEMFVKASKQENCDPTESGTAGGETEKGTDSCETHKSSPTNRQSTPVSGSKLKPPSSRDATNPSRYSQNRTLNMRRSGSLSRIARPSELNYSVSNLHSIGSSATPPDCKEPTTKDKTVTTVNPSAKTKRKIPTLKVPFR